MNIFVLTGAGVSAESGLGTFRDKAGSGIWAKFDPMKLATPEAFAADPEKVHAFYNMRRHNLLPAEPNPAHFALARLEATLSERGGNLFLCTQNIDDLHERAGSRRAVHMHGELLKARCIWCEAVTQWRGDLAARMPARPVAGRAACARTWFGSVRCPSAWM
jgi:NAD-dependent deacetylase